MQALEQRRHHLCQLILFQSRSPDLVTLGLALALPLLQWPYTNRLFFPSKSEEKLSSMGIYDRVHFILYSSWTAHLVGFLVI